jgi:hypothetical protein
MQLSLIRGLMVCNWQPKPRTALGALPWLTPFHAGTKASASCQKRRTINEKGEGPLAEARL